MSKRISLQVYPQENLESIAFRLKEDNDIPIIYSTLMLVGHLATPKNYQDVRIDSILSEQFRHTSIDYRLEKNKIILYQKTPSF